MNWQPIETAPKDGTRILVYRKLERGYEHRRVGVDLFVNDNWRKSRLFMPPTHWMPLPKPPQSSQGATNEQ